MKNYKFFQDVKCTIWARQSFSIEAESYEEALKMAEKFKHEDVGLDSDINADVEWLYDTCEDLEPSDNCGECTIELYDDGNPECTFEKRAWETNAFIGSNTPE